MRRATLRRAALTGAVAKLSVAVHAAFAVCAGVAGRALTLIAVHRVLAHAAVQALVVVAVVDVRLTLVTFASALGT